MKDPRLTMLEDQIPKAAGHYIRRRAEERKKRKAQVPAEREVPAAQDPELKETTEEELAEPAVEVMDEQGPTRRPTPMIPSERAEHKKYQQTFKRVSGKK